MPDGNVGTPGFGENSLRMFEAELRRSAIPFVEKIIVPKKKKIPCTCVSIYRWYSNFTCGYE